MHYAKWDPDYVLHKENMSFHNTRIFALAFWKTINIQKSYKLTYLKIMLIALIFLPIASLFRAYFPPKVLEKMIYGEVDINSLDKMYEEFRDRNVTLPRDSIIFTPPDEFFQRIMEKTIDKLNLKECIAVDNYEEMENLMNTKHYLAAVRLFKEPSIGGLDYEIGFPALLRASADVHLPHFWETDKLFNTDRVCYHSNYTCSPPGYFEEGFIPIQHAIAMSYLELKTENSATLPIFNIVMSKFPTSRLIVDPYRSQMKIMLSVGILFAYIFPTFATVRAITDEEERGIMKMMNIKIKNWCAWLVILFILQTITTLFVLLIIHMSWADYTIFTYTNSWPVFVFLLCYVCASSSFILMISIVLIQKRQSAKYALSLRLFAVVLLPFNLHMEWRLIYKLIACLSLDTALLMGLNIIMDYESIGDSLTLSNFLSPHFAGNSFRLIHATVMLLFDSVIYTLILLYYHYKEVTIVSTTDKETMSRKWYYPLEFLVCFKNPRKVLKKIGLFLLNNLTVHEDDLIDDYPSFRPHELNDKVTQTDWNMGRQHKGTMTRHPTILSTISRRIASVTSLIVSNVENIKEHKKSTNILESSSSAYTRLSSLHSWISHGTSIFTGLSPVSLDALNLINNEPLFDNSHGIQVKNVSKEIGYVKYLDDVSINIHPMEITVILGKNNESRMLLSHIIAGNVTPDSGEVFINNQNVAHYKGNETLCCLLPTDSIIFTQLSTTENMFFYMHLKGMRNFRQIVREIDKYLILMKMSLIEAEQLTDEMSFGQARCLSLCCVLCGGNHAVIVDHPSIGLNQESRYLMWDILKAAARTRVVIVNTIYCDEAEILGTRIAVLHNNKLQCYDRGKRLRELFCNIYILHCDINDSEAADKTYKQFYELLLKHFPNDANVQYLPKLKKIEITFTAVTERQLVLYLDELEPIKDELGLGHVWIRRSTLRDVFVTENVEFSGTENVDKMIHEILGNNLNETKLNELRCQQFRAFNRKRIILMRRFCWIIVLVIIGIPLCILMNLQTSNFIDLPRFNLSIDSYEDTSVIMKRNSELDPSMLNYKISNSYMHYNQFMQNKYDDKKNQLFALTGRREIKSFYLYLDMISSMGVKSFYIAAADFHPNKTVSYWNNGLIHSAPISLNMIHNAISFHLIGPGREIRVANLPITHGDRLILSEMDAHYGMKIGMGFGVMVAICTVVSLMGMPIMWERVSGNMRMQILAGNTKYMYWASHILLDIFIYLIVVAYLMALLLINDAIMHGHHRPDYVDDMSLVLCISFIFVLFGFAALPFVNLLCCLFRRVFLGFAITLLILICSSIGVMIAFTANGYYFVFLRRVFFWSPSFILFMTLRRTHITGALRRACKHLGGCDHEKVCCSLGGFFDYEYPGILSETLVLLCQGILYITLTVYLYWNPLFFDYNCSTQKTQLRASRIDDMHIYIEKKFVNELTGKRLRDMPLVVKGLSNHINLKDLWFHVKPGQVFGILGPSKSGKSTLLSCITGERAFGNGRIYIFGVSLRRNLLASYKYMGFGPRFNTLFEFMTVKEILHFYCILGGRKPHIVHDIVNSLCTYLELEHLMHKRVSRLFFSDKRKIALMIAALSGKKIILFDKPTHGMDPNHKRLIWPLFKLLKQNGYTVVLTTNDIDEAIHLCDNIAIMSKGIFKTVGSLDVLISQNSPGYTLEITRSRVVYSRNPEKLASKESYVKVVRTSFNAEDSSDSEEYTLENSARSSLLFDDPLYANWAKKAARYSNIIAFMNEEFTFATLQENYNNILVYFIPFGNISLSDIFKAMFAAREILDVYTYNVTRPSLEEYYEEKFREDEMHVTRR